MNEFEKALMGDNKIPFNEAAHFFVGIKQAAAEHLEEKTASMADAPDETGELEGQLACSPEQFAALLQECIGKAMALCQAGMLYSASIRGPLACNAKRCFSDWDYKSLIEELTKRAAVLAGAVHLPDIEPPPATNNPAAAVKSMIRGEQELIQCLNAAKEACGEHSYSHKLAHCVLRAQERMDDCWMFLDPESPDPMGGEPALPGAEVPPDEMPGEAPAEEEVPEEVPEEAPPEEEVVEEAPAEEAPVEEEVPEEPEAKTAASMLLTRPEIQEVRGFSERAPGLVGEIREGAQDYRKAKSGRSKSRVAGAAGGTLAGLGASMALKGKMGRRGALLAGLGTAAAGAAGGLGLPHALGYPQKMKSTGTELKKDLGEIRGMSHRMRELRQSSDDRVRRRAESPAKTASVDPWMVARMQASMNKVADPTMGMGQEAPMASPGTGQQTEPTNYLAAEMKGREAQEQNESAYYRGQVQEAQQKAQAGQAQHQELEGQLEQLQMESQENGTMVQESQAQAVAAQDEALRQTQAAANMRMGMQQFRAQLMELASQDPAAQAAQTIQGPAGQPGMGAEQGAVPGAEMGAEPPPQEGAAGQAPDQPMTPGAAPPNGGSVPGGLPAEQAQNPGGVDPMTMQPNAAAGVKAAAVMDKMKAALPGALAGGALGAGYHQSLKGQAPALRDRVQTLEGEQEGGGFMKAMQLAKEKAQLAQAERAEQYPGASMALQAGRGALAGGLMGPSIQKNIQGALGR